MKTIEWQSGAGNKIAITVEAVYGLDLMGRRKDSGRKQVEITATVDGVPHYGHLQTIDHPQVVAKIGKVGITAENYDRIAQGIAAVKQTIADHNAACDNHAANLDSITAAGKAIARIDRMEKKPNRRHAFSREEVARILDAATPEVGQLVTVAICTGLRLGDCCRLEWAYIDLTAGWIRRDLSKTGTRIRMPIMPRLRAMLETLPRDGQWVLPTWAKMYTENRSGVSSRIQQALTAAGVKTGPDRRDFHSFRHAFIWQAAESGIPLPVVQAMVGHLTPAMTALYADHATEQATLAAVARLPDPVTAITKTPPAADLSAMTTADLMAEISRRLAR